MSKLFMTVEDTFLISGRGLVVVPGPLTNEYSGTGSVQVELRKPNGTITLANLTVQFFHQTPPPKEYRWGCVFPSLQKDDVPLGTEIWLAGA
jgi:hypothetical protein